jgi:hypothetical protein
LKELGQLLVVCPTGYMLSSRDKNVNKPYLSAARGFNISGISCDLA